MRGGGAGNHGRDLAATLNRGPPGPGHPPGPGPGWPRSRSMSPGRLRLLLRDLAAAAGFGAMAVSGQVPPWAELLFLMALLVALTGRRPLTDGRASVVVLLAAVLGLYAAVALGGMDL